MRSVWSSKLGFLLAVIGSAVGLGNIWRFSYMAFEHGGGAFLIPYLVALVVAGLPLMILEYTLGHRERASSPLSFARISKKWEWIGWWMPTVALFGIMLYYAVIMGWCLNYLFFSVNLSWGAEPETFFFNEFLQVSDSPFQLSGIRIPIISATFVIWFLCWSICYRGIKQGIERASIIFMPLLFILTLILVGWTLTLDGAAEAVTNIYLKADWSKINIFANPAAWDVWIAAFAQIFFTLSLGFGIMITYSSYLPRRTDIVGNAVWTTVCNSIYSFVVGLAVFGVVGFMASSKGVPFENVIKSGPQLAFVVFPEAIRQLPFGANWFGIIFFSVLLMAGISSGISLIEAFSCAIMDKFDYSRKKVVSLICGLGFLGSVIFTTRAGLLILDIVDHFVTQYGLVLGGVLECALVGWLLKAKVARAHIRRSGGLRATSLWDFSVRYLTPLILMVILIQTFLTEFRAAYGGYEVDALVLFGIDWLVITVVLAVLFTFYPWRPEKLEHDHVPGENGGMA